MAPPTSGPIAIARPAMPPHAPSASGASLGGTAADRIVRRERRDDRAADALDGAGEDQHVARSVRAPPRPSRP